MTDISIFDFLKLFALIISLFQSNWLVKKVGYFYDFSYVIKFKTNINNLSNNEDISFDGDRLGPGGGGGSSGTPEFKCQG